MSQSDNTEYIARISYGKDSLKMLDVIISRGLPFGQDHHHRCVGHAGQAAEVPDRKF